MPRASIIIRPMPPITIALRKDENNRKPELKLDVPDILKMILVDDWEAVTKNHQVKLFIISYSSFIYWISDDFRFLMCDLIQLGPIACYFATNT